ncbi:signal recognition particle, putative [Eimeria acervulina]|uniref:Signal recognition particle subunit SRP68 n=1 Tax=Eimeria acervulina TaxID=5801 RepID=U6G7D6_EIMAC|nr:signal recognition particle, putative [Eimeria acervulina]CDI76166.1 signal recognition particle, putative [Eimeria acervulina]
MWFLLLLLLQAERAWAYGMQLKSDNANTLTPNASLRAHSIRRFSKAVFYARQLEAICKSQPAKETQEAAAAAAAAAGTQSGEAAGTAAAASAADAAAEGTGKTLCDGKTCLDAAAYRCFMESVLLQEKQQWAAAATTLQQLQQLYIQLKHLSSTQPESEQLYKKKLEALEPLLRLCVFHSGDIRAAALQQHQQQQQAGDSKKRAAAAAAAASSSSSNSGCVAVWRGVPVHPKREKPRAAIAAALANWQQQQLLPVETLRALAAAAAAATAAADITAAAPALMERDAQGWAEQYGEASARFRGCVELIHKELMAEPEEASWLQAQALLLLTVGRAAAAAPTVAAAASVVAGAAVASGKGTRELLLGRHMLLHERHLLLLPAVAAAADLKGGREQSRAQEGYRFASLLLQGLERMQGEDSLPDDRRPQLQRWVQVAKDSKYVQQQQQQQQPQQQQHQQQHQQQEVVWVLARAVSTRQATWALKADVRGLLLLL